MTESSELGEPIARGRSADIYDLGDGRVLRRRRDGPISEHEIIAMHLAEAGGVPVPHLHSVDGTDMILDRVEGRDMLGVIGDRPWLAARFGRMLGDLALQLRAVDVDGAVIRATEPREALVHGDLHPGNVLLTDDGPVLIDWEGAGAGPNDADAVTALLLMTVAELDDVPLPLRPVVGVVRATLRRAFLRRVGRPRPETVDQVCELRLADPHMRPVERERIREFGRRYGAGGDGDERP